MDQEKKNTPPDMQLVGINLLILAGYTVVCKLIPGGVILDVLALFFHVLTCLVNALANRSWIWLLSGILILMIGFSICTSFGFDWERA